MVKSKHVLGINARNLLYIGRYNRMRARRFADEKLLTKRVLIKNNVATQNSTRPFIGSKTLMILTGTVFHKTSSLNRTLVMVEKVFFLLENSKMVKEKQLIKTTSTALGSKDIFKTYLMAIIPSTKSQMQPLLKKELGVAKLSKNILGAEHPIFAL